MDRYFLTVLQAASRILSDKRPDRHYAEILAEYAKNNIPEKADFPLDELATVVALELMEIEGDPAQRLEEAGLNSK